MTENCARIRFIAITENSGSQKEKQYQDLAHEYEVYLPFIFGKKVGSIAIIAKSGILSGKYSFWGIFSKYRFRGSVRLILSRVF